MKKNGTPIKKELSVVIPSYNASEWLPKTVPRVDRALKIAGISKAEIIIVDDGSSDNTKKVLTSLNTHFPIVYVYQRNSGRFLARKKGLQKSNYKEILFIDTRVFIDKSALKYIYEKMADKPDAKVWNAHVNVDKKGNVIARFGDAITFIGWRRYFLRPRDTSFDIKDFDYYPKGTTMFFVPKKIIADAIDWFERTTTNIKDSNDDTLLIRHMAESNRIYLSPSFSCTYHARTKLRQFIRHSYHRGRVFVDGFLRRDGNRFYWPLVTFLIITAASPILLFLLKGYLFQIIVLLLLGWIAELLIALMLRVPIKDALSLFILSPPFAFAYGLGIWSAALPRFVRVNR